MKLRFTPQAIQDLSEIKGYISDALHNPGAANRITKMLMDNCSNLKQFPNAGISARTKLGLDTDDRVLLCEKYLVIYSATEDTVSIGRVIDGRQDYARILFKDMK